jgi:DNA uptake protein ComE-like DNA-binding protein
MVDRVAHRNRSESQPGGGGAGAADGADDDASVARRRVFLVLESERESLAAGLQRQFHPLRRYEDLCLVKMVTRLERDSLSHGERAAGGAAGAYRRGARALEHGVADWARPWGPSCMVQLESDLNGFDDKLRHTRRWLPAGSQSAAEARAAERFAKILTRMEASLKLADFTLPSWAAGGSVTPRDGSPGRAPKAFRTRQGARRQAHARGRKSAAAGATRREQPQRAVPEGPINVNQVTYEQLRAMKLTITQSRRLLAYRHRIKRFDSLDQLNALPGFPSTVLERLKDRLSV